jgi:uncharacterized membrane protein
MDDLAVLKTVPLFAAMQESEIIDLRALMQVRSFVAGQVIIREGEPGDSFHVITSGKVQFLTQDVGGRELLLDEAHAGGFFGELSILTGDPRAVRVRAIDPVKTLCLDRQQMIAFLMRHPQAGIEMLTVMGRRLARADALLRQSAVKNVNDAQEEKLTLGARVADTFASMMGSWPFIIVQSTILATWVVLNFVLTGPRRWDPYPFILLNLALSFQAAYSAPIIMMSQNRAADKDRLAADIDHQVNLKAEQQTQLLLARLDDLERGMHTLHQEHQRFLHSAVHRNVANLAQ